MTEERSIIIGGQAYTAVLSENQEILRAAYAAGRTVIGVIDLTMPQQSLSPALYVVESPEDVDEGLLEKAVRRRNRLPWIIAVTPRLLIREFCEEDFPEITEGAGSTEEDAIFCNREKLAAYICSQYVFYEYGIWAVTERSTGRLVGKAGLSPFDCCGDLLRAERALELGYHIFSPYRGLGFGLEACRGILNYAEQELECTVYARIDSSNVRSVHLAEKLGFELIAREGSGAGQCRSLYGWSRP